MKTIDPTEYNIDGIRTFDLVANTTAKLEGTFDDWPSHIQDEIYLALAAKAAQVGLPLEIVESLSDVDIDSGPYVRVRAAYLPPKKPVIFLQ